MAKVNSSNNLGLIPIGGLVSFKGDLPDNYLLCDGSILSQTTYAELYNSIGYSYSIPEFTNILSSAMGTDTIRTVIGAAELVEGIEYAYSVLASSATSEETYAMLNNSTNSGIHNWSSWGVSQTVLQYNPYYLAWNGNNLWVGSTGSSEIKTNSNRDGSSTWTSQTSNNTSITHIAYCNNRFIALGAYNVGGEEPYYSGRVTYSTDGTTWTVGGYTDVASNESPVGIRALYGNGVYLIFYSCAEYAPNILSSSDGETYTYTGKRYNVVDATFDGSYFWLMTSTKIAKHADGSGTWAEYDIPTTLDTARRFIYDPQTGIYYITCDGGYIYYTFTPSVSSSWLYLSVGTADFTIANYYPDGDVGSFTYKPIFAAGTNVYISELSFNPSTQFQLPDIANTIIRYK